MAFTVGELSRMSGVTVRALHHYDAIGLVRPSRRTAAGYRLYEADDVLRLQQVLLFRELGLPLDEIAAAIDRAESREALLRQHREMLLGKRNRLDAMLAAVDTALRLLENARKGGTAMQPEDWKAMFDGFDPSQYEDEAKQRWGDSDAYKESARRTQHYTKADWNRYKQEAEATGKRIVDLMRAGAQVTDAAVQAAVEEHRLLIDRWFYPCSVEMHKALGAMYVQDPRFRANLDEIAPGYAQYLSDAIAAS
jgi:MerR family transcriptional regulator, thiopeptide resistance regulator